ncbi:hypothetical protein K7W42_06085 [Deinococcus sp. HMF7604]|uniref:hypothetical protein n=1 Tax=Deinococcus betulae TaxID=2873312 RepID=UPI001CCB6043|nr:hypothetical protein [Deinococcus betulae]MBZ9750428.1 hypothetical protein [Deinococcus betulae]
MNALGPYVAARELPGRPSSPVRTLRATDRLTGMPVLLHVLSGPEWPGGWPDLPPHPHLLPALDSGQSSGEAYLVTELPLQARPASDPELTARGALSALDALHTRGLVHGGLSRSQLWSVDGHVLLAGAGLPWGGDARPADDLYALAVILDELGGLPARLRALVTQPGTLSAAQALAALTGDSAAPQRLREAPPPPAAPTEAEPTRPSRVSPRPLNAERAAPAPISPADNSAAPHDGTPIVLGDPVAEAAATPAPAAPTPTGPETPQERRRRQNEERRAQAILDAQAAAERRARQWQAEGPPPATPPAPIQIGFADDLPGWTPTEAAPPASRPVPTGPVERLPASLRRPPQPEATGADGPTPAEPAGTLAPSPDTRLPPRLPREPIRIGWDEDESWRVVREAPAPPRTRPAMPEWARPEWFGPRRAAAVLAALVVLGGGWWAMTHRPEQTAPLAPALGGCCDVRVTLRGAAATAANLNLLSAPDAARLTPGQQMGQVPGTLHLPVPGTYRFKVVAPGWSPANLTVTVPRRQPVTIDLSD